MHSLAIIINIIKGVDEGSAVRVRYNEDLKAAAKHIEDNVSMRKSKITQASLSAILCMFLNRLEYEVISLMIT